MDDAWQSQDMAPSAAGGISIPTTDVNMTNGNGVPTADDQTWAPSGTHSPRGNGGDPPRRSSRSRSPVARDGGDRGGRGENSNPGNNLHVSGLSTRVDTRDLEAAFTKVGRVQKAQVMYDPHTRESRGFGFVTMETPEEAEAAITALNATELFGKTISVEKARRGRARTPTPGRYYGPPKRHERGAPRYPEERPYDPRPYDSRYRDYDRRGGRYDDYRRYDDRDRYKDYDRRYDDRRYDDRRDYDRDRYRDYDRRYDDRRY